MILQGICCYDDHLYIAVYKESGTKSYIYKVNTSLKNISKKANKASYKATKVASFSGSEIEGIDIKKVKKKATVYYSANVNKGGPDSGVDDYVGKLTLK